MLRCTPFNSNLTNMPAVDWRYKIETVVLLRRCGERTGGTIETDNFKVSVVPPDTIVDIITITTTKVELFLTLMSAIMPSSVEKKESRQKLSCGNTSKENGGIDVGRSIQKLKCTKRKGSLKAVSCANVNSFCLTKRAICRHAHCVHYIGQPPSQKPRPVIAFGLRFSLLPLLSIHHFPFPLFY
uniref:Uncharacterized protein n=1 Tax=Trypanosoma congolense (strain IL3000) TaxID=1068625 RepID=G0UM06_TRYCI|nr:hypothetical protein TCIL3000_5_4150 [Trypanosoma congolense IL3000]